jgi:glycosyltransferase involved in cell wall biosynthesis
MINALSNYLAITNVTALSPRLLGKLEPRDESLGLEQDLILWNRKPELWHRWQAWRRLRAFYIRMVEEAGVPDFVHVRNLHPIYNHFIRWLRRQQPRPLCVLGLADSNRLGRRMPLLRRLRYRLKPMTHADDQVVTWFDACISFSNSTRDTFERLGVPWLWMPSAYNFKYDPPPPDDTDSTPIRFGYFGVLAEHAAVVETTREFLAAELPGTLHVAGYGRLTPVLQELADQHPQFCFDGLLPTQASCLAWAQQVDVLINPRLAIWGNENSFPSKIFEYAMAGKAILTTRTGGVDEVLGEEAFYMDNRELGETFRHQLRRVAALSRPELQRRGAALRARVLEHYSWPVQARRMAQFLSALQKSPPK